jgi:hypothetical protein
MMKSKAAVASIVFVAFGLIPAYATAEVQDVDLKASQTDAKDVLYGPVARTNFRWGTTTTNRAPSLITDTSPLANPGATAPASSESVASADAGDSTNGRAQQSIYKWGIRSSSNQSIYKWGIRSTADQSIYKWGIRSTADQSIYKWGIRSTADQSIYKWGIR